MKNIINKIKNSKANDFDLQELVKFLANNIETMNVGEEIMIKEYIRKGAEQLSIDIEDVQAVYNYHRRKSEKIKKRNC